AAAACRATSPDESDARRMRKSGIEFRICTTYARSMIPRAMTAELEAQPKEYPVVTVIGPRQAGKTTLVRSALPDYEYLNLESPEIRAIAQDDPKALLSRHSGKTILDEVQRAPQLLSYVQGIVDEQRGNGQFVLTGSHQLAL